MKKLLVTAMGAALIVSGGMYAVNGAQVEASGQKGTTVHYHNKIVQENRMASTDLSKLPEYATIAPQVDLSKYSLRMVEDNTNKRVILVSDANGIMKYKTIYIKKTGLVKVIKLF